LEKLGTFVVLIAIVLIISDPQAVRKGETVNYKVSFLSLLGNIPGVSLWISTKQLMEKLDTLTVLCLTIIGMTTLTIIPAITYEGALLDMSDAGIFGCLKTKNMFLTFFLAGHMCGFWAWSGYVISLQYFSSFIVMNTLLLEPFVSQVIGIIKGIDEVPGVLTWITMVIIIIALNILDKGSSKK